jgi:hypothetical protein
MLDVFAGHCDKKTDTVACFERTLRLSNGSMPSRLSDVNAASSAIRRRNSRSD